MILVCAHCRCDKCEVIDDKEIKWGDGI
jgi:hypothetical protein